MNGETALAIITGLAVALIFSVTLFVGGIGGEEPALQTLDPVPTTGPAIVPTPATTAAPAPTNTPAQNTPLPPADQVAGTWHYNSTVMVCLVLFENGTAVMTTEEELTEGAPQVRQGDWTFEPRIRIGTQRAYHLSLDDGEYMLYLEPTAGVLTIHGGSSGTVMAFVPAA
ncbi:hypothetical protein [Methanofollis fontis]|uniref:Uncharacterized protein n=1 Tax=Methanofollis fontis TaxID=2052832 RepID=A0A483CQR3_9EURY|nr:hypothetical protein [Methanofollis fontis]TAJ43545.1 hypothetical protein CUJ86_10465 [Methanofollis fontis]